MNIRTIPRTAVKGSIRVVRLPVDAALRAVPDGEQQRRTTAKLALDLGYLERRGLREDLRVLADTLGVVLPSLPHPRLRRSAAL